MPTGDTPTDGRVRSAVQDWQKVADARANVWHERVSPHLAKLAEAGIKLTEADFRPATIDKTAARIRRHLPAAERADLIEAAVTHAELRPKLLRASEQLGVAGEHLLVAREFPTGRVVTASDDKRGTPGNLDSVVLVSSRDTGSVIAIEAKGAGSQLGSRLVDNPAHPAGPKVRAEQGSPEYLRHMLQNDNKLLPALGREPVLFDQLRRILADPTNGLLRYVLVKTSTVGKVTATDFNLDPDRLRRDSIRLPPPPDPGREPQP